MLHSQFRTGIGLLCLALMVVVPSAAQTINSSPLTLTSSTLAEGQAGIPLTTTFDFTFSRNLPFSSLNNPAFRFEPRRLLSRDKYFFGGTKTVEFTITHQANTDYVMYAFGVLTCDPDNARSTGCFTEPPGGVLATTVYLQNQPVVRNYTTSPTMGTLQASGTVQFGDVSQPPAKAGGRAAGLRALIDEAFSEDYVGETEAMAFDCSSPTDIRNTVVFLLDRYTFDAFSWTPRLAAVPTSNGQFQMTQVRSGQYWPIAIHFADRCGKTVARYGYHDANGDFEPDPVQVSVGGVSGLNLVLMPDEPILARGGLAVAQKRAGRAFADAELQRVFALNPAADGRATAWRYEFYSPSQAAAFSVDVGSFNTQTFTGEPRPDAESRLAIPEAFVESSTIVQKAEDDGGADFRALFPGENVEMSLELGDLPLLFRPAEPSVFWQVRYESPFTSSQDTTLTLFYDAETGARLEGVVVGREPGEAPAVAMLSAPSPHPVRGTAAIRYTTAQAGRVRLAVYDVLGREVRTLVDAATPPGDHEALFQGTDLPSGTYFLRLQVGGFVTQRAFVLLR